MTGPAHREDRPLFILHGNGSVLNRGCEAILRSTVGLLRTEFGTPKFLNAPAAPLYPEDYLDADPDLVHLSPPPIQRWSPRWWSLQLQRRVLRRKPPMPFERYIHRAQAVLALGGDNYSLDYGLPVPFFDAIQATLRRDKPMVLWGASVGPFSAQPDFERFAARVLRDVTLILARETLTVEYLASIGVKENVRLVADPAFLLQPEDVALSGDERVVLDEPCLGLNLSPLVGRYCGGGPQAWRDLARACVHVLSQETRIPIVLVPHVVLPGNDDHAFMEEALRQLDPRSDKVVLLDRRLNARQLKGIIAKLALFIGARTHATIAALSSHVPTISIGYSMKARGINQDIFGHTDWVIGIQDLTPQSLAKKTGALLDKADAVRQQLEGKIPEIRERARSAGRHLRAALRDG